MLKRSRSIRATLIEIFFKIARIKVLKTAPAAKKYMNKLANAEDKSPKINVKKYGRNIHTSELSHSQIVKFGDDNSQQIVIYLHGGAYVAEITSAHLDFCDKLSKEIGGEVYVPIYPLTPKHTYGETYDLLTDLYKKIAENTEKKITIMGDSAGGGLAIAFCQHLVSIGLRQPDNLVALSPWMDISMSGDKKQYDIYQKKDPILGVEGLKEIGKMWGGDTELENPKVSPIFGNNTDLPKTLLFVGTHELFNPDVVKYYKKLKADGIDANLIVGEKMNHVYPLFPIPEAKVAFEQIVEQIKG